MNYSIDKETVVSIDSGIVSVRAELWAESASDIPAYDAVEGRILLPGSIAIVPAEGKFYVLSFANVWAEWGTEPVVPDDGNSSEAEE